MFLRHYYDQMQGQLEVCGLFECDFLQCEIEEYPNRDAYLGDNDIEFKGSVMEYMDENNELKFIYSKVNMNEEELDKWINGNKIKLNSENLIM